MAIEATTKDTTALSDGELAEMAELGVEAVPFDAGTLSKIAGEWVLVSEARREGALAGYALATLERIGGTPSLLLGLAAFREDDTAEEALLAVLGELFRRALLAFPDEDVLVGTRLVAPAGLRVYAGLSEVIPRDGHRPTGEERAWGRRLAKRFGAEGRLDDRRFLLTGSGVSEPVLAYSGPAPTPGPELAELFGELDRARGDTVVVFGWAMADDLVAGQLPR